MNKTPQTYQTTTSEGHIFDYHRFGSETIEETIRRHHAEDVPDAVEVATDETNMIRFEAPDGWWSENRW